MEKKEGILFEILNELNFELVKKLGESGFGLSYEVKKDNKYYAAKLIESSKEIEVNTKNPKIKMIKKKII